MSSNLYLLFEGPKGRITVDWVEGLKISGYSFSEAPTGDIKAPDERRLPVQCFLYARDYFRIYVAEMAVLFRRDSPLPRDLAVGEREFQAAILTVPDIRLRRWIATNENYDDDDNLVVQILGEGKEQGTLKAYQALFADS